MAFRVIIAGGRDFRDYRKLEKACDIFLSQKKNIIVLSGGAKGADSLGERYALLKGYDCQIIKAEWEKYGKSAGYRRNVQMAEKAHAVICFWDGKSKGTKHMIDIAREREIPLRVVKY